MRLDGGWITQCAVPGCGAPTRMSARLVAMGARRAMSSPKDTATSASGAHRAWPPGARAVRGPHAGSEQLPRGFGLVVDGMVGRAEVLGQPARGLRTPETRCRRCAVERHHRSAGAAERRPTRGPDARDWVARRRARGTGRAMSSMSRSRWENSRWVRRIQPRRSARGRCASDRDPVLHTDSVEQVAVEFAAGQLAGLEDVGHPEGRTPAGRVRDEQGMRGRARNGAWNTPSRIAYAMAARREARAVTGASRTRRRRNGIDR